MSQTTVIAAVIIAAFVFYITVKGQLPAYIKVIGL